MDETLFPDRWLEAEGLPASFRDKIAGLWRPLAERISAGSTPGKMSVVGLCGPQGSGKTTGAMALERLLSAKDLKVARLSIDDLYLERSERLRLAAKVHRLLATRGPPGTHDTKLGLKIFAALSQPGQMRLPRFDKAADDRAPELSWPIIQGPVDVVLFEGWCVGAKPQPPQALALPVNALEAEEDSDGVWRRYANDALAEEYQSLFGAIDFLIQLRAPSFQTVLGWRQEQERKLRAGGGAKVMNDEEIARFIQFYERLTRWIDAEMPERADLLVQLDEKREPRFSAGV